MKILNIIKAGFYDKSKQFAILMFSILFLFFIYYGASAALVPCGYGVGAPCTLCDLLVMVNNIVNFLTAISISIATIMILWGGFLLLMAAGNEEKLKSAKSVLTTAIIGLVIVLVSWIIINTLIVFFGSSSGFPWPWYQINC